MNDVSVSPGARLKRERERQGLSLQKAADELRLDPAAIEALEADQYDKVGPAVYARGHLKKFALLLSIPQQEILDGYAALQTAPSASPPQPTNLGLGSATRVGFERAPLPPLPLAAGLLGLAIVIGLFWWSPWKAHSPTAAPPPVPLASSGPVVGADSSAAGVPAADNDEVSRPSLGAVDTPPPAPANGSPPATPAPALAGAAAAATAAAASAGAGRARLRLSFSADSWVDVHDASGRRVFAGNGRANSVKTIAGQAPLRVYLGFASGVQLEINEHAVAIARPFLNGDVARFEAGADGVLRQSSGAVRPRG